VYLYALLATLVAVIGSDILGVSWARLVTTPPLRQIAEIGPDAALVMRMLVVSLLYSLAFGGIGLALSIIGTLSGDPGLARRIASWPARWADPRRPELVWQGSRPYAWLALALPFPLLVIVGYAAARQGVGRVEQLGEICAFILLAGIAAGQTLHPFRWRVSFFPSLPALGDRVGAATTIRAHDRPAVRPMVGEPPQPPLPTVEEWIDHFTLVQQA
jgi:hypothetical protein